MNAPKALVTLEALKTALLIATRIEQSIDDLNYCLRFSDIPRVDTTAIMNTAHTLRQRIAKFPK